MVKKLLRAGVGFIVLFALGLQVNFAVSAESSENKVVDFDVKLKNPADIADLKNLEQYLKQNPYDIEKIDEVTNLIIAAVEVLNSHYSKYPKLKKEVFQRKLKFKSSSNEMAVTPDLNYYYVWGGGAGFSADKNGDLYLEESKAWDWFYVANGIWLGWLDTFDRVTWHYIRNEFFRGFCDGWKRSGGKIPPLPSMK